MARDLFQRYFLSKYGVSFVLIFFGFEMLLHDVFHNPNVVCMLMIIVAQKLVAYENHRTMQQLRDSMVLELRLLFLAAFVLMALDHADVALSCGVCAHGLVWRTRLRARRPPMLLS